MTPIVSADRILSGLSLKIEYRNPSLSIKHRCLPAYLRKLADSGEITQDTKLAILSAGSAGMAVAWAANQLGCRATILVPQGTPPIVLQYIAWMGCEVVQLTTADALTKLEELRQQRGWLVVEQLSESSLCEHYEIIGHELLGQLPALAAVIVGAGTAASVMGIARVVRPKGVQVFAVEPSEASVLQLRPWRPHGISGLAPPMATALFRRAEVDGVLSVSSPAAWDASAEVLRLTGEPVGPSSGACVVAAREVRERLSRGDIVAICSSSMVTALGGAPIPGVDRKSPPHAHL